MCSVDVLSNIVHNRQKVMNYFYMGWLSHILTIIVDMDSKMSRNRQDFLQEMMENRFQIETITEDGGSFDLHAELLRVDNEIIRHSTTVSASNSRRREIIRRARAKLIVELAAGKKSKSIFPTAEIVVGDHKFNVLVKTEVAEQIVDLVRYLIHAGSKSYQEETVEVVTLAAQREANEWMEHNETDLSRFDQHYSFNLREFRHRYIRENGRAWKIPGGGDLWIHSNKLIKTGPSPWEWLAPAILDSSDYIGICALDNCQRVFHKIRKTKSACSDRCRLTLAQRAYREKNAGLSCADIK